MEVLNSWPRDRSVVMLYSGDQHEQFSRWSILAEPRGWLRWYEPATAEHQAPAANSDKVGDDFEVNGQFPEVQSPGKSGELGGWEVSGQVPISVEDLPVSDPLTVLDHILECGRSRHDDDSAWVVLLHYELGREIEPRASHIGKKSTDLRQPLISVAWCPDRLIFNEKEQFWVAVGAPDDDIVALVEPGHSEFPEEHPGNRKQVADAPTATNLAPTWDKRQHIAAVERIKEYIAAGDIFQANLTQQFSSTVDCSPRQLATTAFRTSRPRYGAYIELPDDEVIISLSPELFLDYNADSRTIITRPIKGTLPSTEQAIDLWQSEKDAAELHMIVDLMRNDIGRVCEFGSIKVANSRTIETHPTVHHGVAEVIGRVRDKTSPGEMIRATFPAGSITGAPKIRAMQIIDELEPQRRGIYCGSIGMVDGSGSFTLNVAIRTLALQRTSNDQNWQLNYGAGGGIVADSDPAREWAECLQKVAVLRKTLEMHNE